MPPVKTAKIVNCSVKVLKELKLSFVTLGFLDKWWPVLVLSRFLACPLQYNADQETWTLIINLNILHSWKTISIVFPTQNIVTADTIKNYSNSFCKFTPYQLVTSLVQEQSVLPIKLASHSKWWFLLQKCPQYHP